jgi:hypothetical protein
MDLDNSQDNASMAESRQIENSGSLGGQYSSLLNIVELEYANSNSISNPNFDPSSEEPPTYEIASTRPLYEMPGNLSDNPPLELASHEPGNPRLSTTLQRAYEPPAMQTETESIFCGFCKLLKSSPLFTLNFSHGSSNTSHGGFGVNVNLGFRYFVIIACLCFVGWLVWKLHK